MKYYQNSNDGCKSRKEQYWFEWSLELNSSTESNQTESNRTELN